MITTLRELINIARDTLTWPQVILAGCFIACVVQPCVQGCGGTLGQQGPTVLRATLGGLYGACQTVDSQDATWRGICDGVEQAMPALNQLGAGPAELPPDVAAREVTITIGGE